MSKSCTNLRNCEIETLHILIELGRLEEQLTTSSWKLIRYKGGLCIELYGALHQTVTFFADECIINNMLILTHSAVDCKYHPLL